MPECPRLSSCPFFGSRLTSMPTTAELTKKHDGLGDYEDCARFMVVEALSSASVPEDLYPDQTERAEQIIRRGER